MHNIYPSFNIIFAAIANFAEVYSVLILIKLSLVWFPNINWYTEPFWSLSRITDPYLKLFRGTIPMIFGMDMSPMLGILFLQCLMIIFNNIAIIEIV